MSEAKQDGGPAFPVDGWKVDLSGEFPPSPTKFPGMSLRQWYAGMAMQGDFAAQGGDVGEIINDTGDDWMEHRARLYLRMADALIREGQK